MLFLTPNQDSKPCAQPAVSEHWRQVLITCNLFVIYSEMLNYLLTSLCQGRNTRQWVVSGVYRWLCNTLIIAVVYISMIFVSVVCCRFRVYWQFYVLMYVSAKGNELCRNGRVMKGLLFTCYHGNHGVQSIIYNGLRVRPTAFNYLGEYHCSLQAVQSVWDNWLFYAWLT